VGKATRHIDVVAFVHRLGLYLNGHLNFHVRAVDGVPEEVAGDNRTSRKPVFVSVGSRCSGADRNHILLFIKGLRKP
jgi:hypothetical protein